jgi:hypothetical protein
VLVVAVSAVGECSAEALIEAQHWLWASILPIACHVNFRSLQSLSLKAGQESRAIQRPAQTNHGDPSLIAELSYLSGLLSCCTGALQLHGVLKPAQSTLIRPVGLASYNLHSIQVRVLYMKLHFILLEPLEIPDTFSDTLRPGQRISHDQLHL